MVKKNLIEDYIEGIDNQIGTMLHYFDSLHVRKTLESVKGRLLECKPRNGSLDHDSMVVFYAAKLAYEGWNVDVEHPLKSRREYLRCDICARNGRKIRVVEVEGSQIPPEHLKKFPREVCQEARIIGKIVRYAPHLTGVDELYLTFPKSSYNLDEFKDSIKFFFKNLRSEGEARKIKEIADLLYTNTPIRLKDVMEAKVNEIDYINMRKREITPYMKNSNLS